MITEKMELGQALAVGAFISFVTLVVNLISNAKRRASNSYEAVVIDKQQKWSEDSDGFTHTEYITVVRTAGGRRKKIRESSNGPSSAYDYLRIGERFRYHPQLMFPYEKYDKSSDGYVYCACCTAKNDLRSDRCSRCGAPLLK